MQTKFQQNIPQQQQTNSIPSYKLITTIQTNILYLKLYIQTQTLPNNIITNIYHAQISQQLLKSNVKMNIMFDNLQQFNMYIQDSQNIVIDVSQKIIKIMLEIQEDCQDKVQIGCIKLFDYIIKNQQPEAESSTKQHHKIPIIFQNQNNILSQQNTPPSPNKLLPKQKTAKQNQPSFQSKSNQLQLYQQLYSILQKQKNQITNQINKNYHTTKQEIQKLSNRLINIQQKLNNLCHNQLNIPTNNKQKMNKIQILQQNTNQKQIQKIIDNKQIHQNQQYLNNIFDQYRKQKINKNLNLQQPIRNYQRVLQNKNKGKIQNKQLLTSPNKEPVIKSQSMKHKNRVFYKIKHILQQKQSLHQQIPQYIDPKSAYLCCFTFNSKIITLTTRPLQKQSRIIMLLGSSSISQQYSYKFKIIKCINNSPLGFGIVDNKYRDKKYCRTGDNIIKINRKGIIINCNKIIKQQHSFCKKTTSIEMKIYEQLGIIEWLCDQYQNYRVTNLKIKDKSIRWVPFIQMKNIGDTIQWIS